MAIRKAFKESVNAEESNNIGARREGRTPTLVKEPDFESGASASSAIRAMPFGPEISTMNLEAGQTGKKASLSIWHKPIY